MQTITAGETCTVSIGDPQHGHGSQLYNTLQLFMRTVSVIDTPGFSMPRDNGPQRK